MRYFVNVEFLADLEKQGEWEKARGLLYKKWSDEKMNSGLLIRLLSECWYILSEWDNSIAGNKELSFQTVKGTLIECTEFGMKNCTNNSQFLCVAGYMISLFPHLFYNGNLAHNSDSLYTEWEQRGIKMLRKSHETNPSDKIANVLNLGTTMNLANYDEAKIAMQSELQYIFPDETTIELYFKDIFSIGCCLY